MIPKEAQKIITALNLEPLLPEGGFFKRTFACKEILLDRPSMTCIYYLITETDFSAFHRLKSAEIYHFYAGDKVELHLIEESGSYRSIVLGNDFNNCVPQIVVESGTWQACKIQPGQKNGWALMGTTVSPGFDFADFELGDLSELIKTFQQHNLILKSLTR